MPVPVSVSGLFFLLSSPTNCVICVWYVSASVPSSASLVAVDGSSDDLTLDVVEVDQADQDSLIVHLESDDSHAHPHAHTAAPDSASLPAPPSLNSVNPSVIAAHTALQGLHAAKSLHTMTFDHSAHILPLAVNANSGSGGERERDKERERDPTKDRDRERANAAPQLPGSGAPRYSFPLNSFDASEIQAAEKCALAVVVHLLVLKSIDIVGVPLLNVSVKPSSDSLKICKFPINAYTTAAPLLILPSPLPLVRIQFDYCCRLLHFSCPLLLSC